MSDTSSQDAPATGMTPGIAQNQLQKGVADKSGRFVEPDDGARPDQFVVRIPKMQTSVSLRLNTKLLAEQREIEQTNEAIRRAGR
jgi:hypothetical protein